MDARDNHTPQTDPVLLEQMDKRFDQAHRHTNHWMTFLSIVLLALTTVVSLGFFFAG